MNILCIRMNNISKYSALLNLLRISKCKYSNMITAMVVIFGRLASVRWIFNGKLLSCTIPNWQWAVFEWEPNYPEGTQHSFYYVLMEVVSCRWNLYQIKHVTIMMFIKDWNVFLVFISLRWISLQALKMQGQREATAFQTVCCRPPKQGRTIDFISNTFQTSIFFRISSKESIPKLRQIHSLKSKQAVSIHPQHCSHGNEFLPNKNYANIHERAKVKWDVTVSTKIIITWLMFQVLSRQH